MRIGIGSDLGGLEFKERLKIPAVERHLSANLLEVLTMADQAKLERRRGTTNSVAAIEAASTLVRIAYRCEMTARVRIAGSPVLQPKNILERRATFEQACCAALEIQLVKLGHSDSPELSQCSAPPITDLAPMTNDFTAAESTHLSPETRILWAAELESYRRFPVLLASLDAELSKVVV
jgi:hypothetical protein